MRDGFFVDCCGLFIANLCRVSIREHRASFFRQSDLAPANVLVAHADPNDRGGHSGGRASAVPIGSGGNSRAATGGSLCRRPNRPSGSGTTMVLIHRLQALHSQFRLRNQRSKFLLLEPNHAFLFPPNVMGRSSAWPRERLLNGQLSN
jgi:Superfamily I DNA and RNA helicases